MKYKEKETGKIKEYEEIRKEHIEIIYNNSYAEDDITDIRTLSQYITMFYDIIE